MSLMNRLGTAGNIYQQVDTYKRVLCVCSAGCLRSPTAAVVLAGEPFNLNTRAAGSDEEFAIIPVDDVLIAWADEIVFMEERHRTQVLNRFSLNGKLIQVLSIPDQYSYRAPTLVELIKERYRDSVQLAIAEVAP